MKRICTLSLGLISITPWLNALEVEVQRMGDPDPYLPWGYTDTSVFDVDEDPNLEGRQNSVEWKHADSIQLSEAPYVDYFVAFNSGVAGVLAEKKDAPFLDAAESTIPLLSGGANGSYVPDFEDRQFPDRYASGEMPVGSELITAIASWTDGVPLPSANSWYGVSWGGASATEVEEMEVRVNLASDEPVNIAHLFNDGWYYSSDIGDTGGGSGFGGTAHTVLDGHEFTVTHYSADGTVIAEEPLVLPSGGAEHLASETTGITFWPTPEQNADVNRWKQFYTALITVTRQAEGDYLIIKHRAANLGYRMTLVTLGDDRPWDDGSGEPTTWLGYDVGSDGWADTGDWTSFVNVFYDPWIWVQDLGAYTYIRDDSGWVYIPKN